MTDETRQSEFYLDNVLAKDTGDKVELSTDKLIKLKYSVFLH